MKDRAARLHSARLDRSPIPMLTEADPGLDLDGAYAVQEAGIAMREADGETIVGGKLGFTSRAMQSAMGVDHPNYGWLTDAMVIDDGRVPLGDLIHPKVEPEIAFLLEADLDPPVSVSEVLAATSALLPCLEIVDSRFVDFRFRALDNISDNSSAAMVAFGDPVSPTGTDLALLGVAVSENGAIRHTAAGAAALDHPAAAVAWMANHSPRPLRAGWIVISGGLTAPIDVRPGTVVTADFDRIGSVTLTAA
jgi:2-oxo-3-hexenedioate decarboxylase